MNPARSFGPSLITGDWANHWLYWIGPITGGVVGAVCYHFLFQPSQKEEEAIVVEGTVVKNGSNEQNNQV